MKLIILIVSILLFTSTILLSQAHGIVNIGMRGPIQFMVTDSLGRRTGKDARTGLSYQEIPNTGYGIGCCGSIDPADSGDDEGAEFTFLKSIDSSFHDKYTFQIFGIWHGIYQGGIDLFQTLGGKGTFSDEVGVIDTLQSVIYKINFSTDSTIPPTVTKIVDVPLLIQDLNNCSNLGLIKNQPLYRGLSTIAHQTDSTLRMNDTTKARYHLLRFGNLIDTASADTSKIDSVAYSILKEDFNILFRSVVK